MSSVVMLPSGRFRAFAQVRSMREAQVFDRRPEALLWADKTEKRMHAGTWTKAVAVPIPDRGLTVAKALEQYLQSPGWLNKAENTRRVELQKHKPMLATFGPRLLRDITRDDVEAYIAARQRTQTKRDAQAQATVAAQAQARGEKPAKWAPRCMSGHQVRLEVASLAAVCKFALRKKWLDVSPTAGAEKPKTNRRTQRVDDELMGRILQHDAIINDSTAYLFFRILFSSVCRPGELATARREWLRADPPQIHIPRTKNEDERSILIPVGTYRMLVEYLQEQDGECPYLFGTRKLRTPGWSPYNYATPWRKVAKDHHLVERGVVPYLARHEGISRLFERTKLSDGQIAGLSGHRSAQALWHYKHLRNEHQRPIMNALDTMVSNAIDRAITQLHPSRGLRPGEMLTPEPSSDIDLSDNIELGGR